MTETVTSDNTESFGDFRLFRKTATSRISTFTMPPGTTYQTPEGLRAEDEETRIAFDVQGGVYPIRESVFQASYALATAEPSDLDVALDAAIRRYVATVTYIDISDSLDFGQVPELAAYLAAAITDTLA